MAYTKNHFFCLYDPDCTIRPPGIHIVKYWPRVYDDASFNTVFSMNQKSGDLVSNRRATYNHEILETFEAGIVLQGTEIKSLRDNGGSLQEAYVKVIGEELWLIACSIAPYRFGNVYNHEERRERKLLMHKREIAKLRVATQEKGLTIIPLAFYLKNGRVKVRIATARGKKTEDKRAAIKERDEKRHIQKVMKEHR